MKKWVVNCKKADEGGPDAYVATMQCGHTLDVKVTSPLGVNSYLDCPQCSEEPDFLDDEPRG